MFSHVGHFSCGNRKCDEKNGLRSWEVNFAYVEGGEKKNALVKLSKLQIYTGCELQKWIVQHFWNCSYTVFIRVQI